MGRRRIRASYATATCFAVCVGCSGNNLGIDRDPGGRSGDGATLAVLSHDPAHHELHVESGRPIRIEVDGVLMLDCLQDRDTWLKVEGDGAPIDGAFSLDGHGETLVFTPSTPLEHETTYVMQISALTCDVRGRLLEEPFRFEFRTVDESPPRVVSSDVADGATDVDRNSAFRLTFDEELDPASATRATVALRDAGGSEFPIRLRAEDRDLFVEPIGDLPGARSCALVVDGVADRSGNPTESEFSVSFTTRPDVDAPALLSTWPDRLGDPIAPDARPALFFDESVDPESIESATLRLNDEYGNIVPFAVTAAVDRRTLRIVPADRMVPGRRYYLNVFGGPGALTDLSGNPLDRSTNVTFLVSPDDVPPAVESVEPGDGATGVAPYGRLLVRFTEAIDPYWLDPSDVELRGPTGAVAVAVSVDDRDVAVAPDAVLDVLTDYTLTLRAGHSSLSDLAGNPLAEDVSVAFRTGDDASPPQLRIWPATGAASVPINSHATIYSDAPLDPASVDAIRVTDPGGREVPGQLTLTRGDQVIRFLPSGGWRAGLRYRLTVAGGPTGLRKANGNGLLEDVTKTILAGYQGDATPPQVEVTLNGIDALRSANLSVPPHGFDIQVIASDPEFALDMSSTDVTLSGPAEAEVPDGDAIFASARVTGRSLTFTVPPEHALAPGRYDLEATVTDLSGNRGTSARLTFSVHEPDPGVMPFERTQVVWVRTDFDRDANQANDFYEDLVRLGLCADGDPAGTDARMIQVVHDGILARARMLYGRAASGGRTGPDSASVLLVDREPRGLSHMQIALGGMDPQGAPGRGYADDTTGTLGRAFFDYANGNFNDRNIGTDPGLGVFPGELYLFETQVHERVYPSFLTAFARRFIKLCPDMGGTPVGLDPLDARVVRADFDFDGATSAERARYTAIFSAADDWATAIGTILAHEIGHAVGLVARGRLSRGLHGDATLHNEFAAVTDVMSATVGYDSMVGLEYSFRDLNIAYLRQRIVLR